MSKTRIYELAKELNMDSKEVVEKLQKKGINVKSYMSTLDEYELSMAKKLLTDNTPSESEIIEEKRVSGRVIRRRRRIVKTAPEQKVEEKEKKEEKEEVRAEEKEQKEEVAEAKEKEKIKEEQKETEVKKKEEEEKVEKKAEEEKKEEPEKLIEEVKEEKEEVREEKLEQKEKEKIEEAIEEAQIEVQPKEEAVQKVQEQEVEKKEEEKKEERIEAQQQKTEVTIPTTPEFLEEKEEEKEKEKEVKKKKKEKKKAKKKELIPTKVYKKLKKEIYEKEDLYDEEYIARRKLKPVQKPKKKEQKKKKEESKKPQITVPKPSKRKIKVQEYVTVSELAKSMGVKASELIKKLLSMGVVATINQSIDFETASLVADEFGYELELDTFKEEDLIEEVEDRPEDLKPRPPVVTIMGHVDHGKTTLLDYIRHSNVTEQEVGGITQHIGAYYVETEEGDIVFLDTPGHEAFTEMRARGAQVTDIIVLVVAADDGVMPQTKEAINHAKAANIPIIVAINKIDKPDAKPEMVKRQLAELGLLPEEWGGDILVAEISAKTGQGVDELLSLILLQAEMLELKANPNRPAKGTVIESKLDRTKGPVATVLIKTGTLKKGDHFVCGEHYGRVRAMVDHQGRRINSAGPSMPVEIYGISGVPTPGDDFIVVKNEKIAKEIVEHRKKKKAEAATKKGVVSLEDLYAKIQKGEIKELNLIIKADVHGSLEALEKAVSELSTEDIKISIIHSGIGAITESDVMLASASHAIIIGFNVRAVGRVKDLAEKEKVDIRYYNVIYDVIDDIKKAMKGLLEPEYRENIIGHAEVKQTFRIPKVGTVAGCLVSDGRIERNAKVRVLRDGVVVYEGKIGSLKRYKEDVKEVPAGYECGVGIEGFNDIKEGDILEIYNIEQIQPEI